MDQILYTMLPVVSNHMLVVVCMCALQLEIEDGKEFTVDEFYTALHPARSVVNQKFARPRGPSGRKGTSRLTSYVPLVRGGMQCGGRDVIMMMFNTVVVCIGMSMYP